MAKIFQTAATKYLEPYRMSLAQKAFLGPYFGLRAMMDPTRGDMVAALGDTLGERAARAMLARLKATECGRALLLKKPLISSTLIVDKVYPENTLGRRYQRYMQEHGFDADERSKVRFVDDPDIAYVIVRYRQVHDFWHVLCGLPPTVLGEIALKWFEWNETGLPSCGLSALVGPMKLTSEETYLLVSSYIPWAVRAAHRSTGLMTYMYEKNLYIPLDIVRQELNIEPAPAILASM